MQRTLDESALGAGVEVLEPGVRARSRDGPQRCRRPAGGRRAHRRDRRRRRDRVGRCGDCPRCRDRLGGYGQVFASTSNPPAVTGDGVALAMRAGLPVTDVEFVQFHPTVLWRGPGARGQQALVSEAVRGEGAILYDAAGERVMKGVHPEEDLAPRDVVAAAISSPHGRGTCGSRRPRLPRCHAHGRAVLRTLPVDHRRLPRDRHRPRP